MFTENLQAITLQAGNFQRGNMMERGARIGSGMGNFGFHPLLAFFGFLLFVLFIFVTVRVIMLAKHSGGNYGFGYMRHMHERYQGNEKCACENSTDQNRGNQNPWSHKQPDEALEILRKRYAAGEIKKEEFEEKEQILKS